MKNDKFQKLTLKIRRRLAGKFRAMAWRLSGREPQSDNNLSIIYFGGESQKNYLAKLVFGDSYKESYDGKKWFWEIYKIAKNNKDDHSLIVIEGSDLHRKLYEEDGDFFIPCWVNGELDIPLDTRKKHIKGDLRSIRKNKLEYIEANEPDLFHYFYHEMHLPYVTRRFGNTSLPLGYNGIKQAIKTGTCSLLLIKKENEYIAGELIKYEGDNPKLWVFGVKDGDPSYLQDGALTAAYHFACAYLKDRGYKSVNVGSSRAFLDDGVLRYKKTRGMRLVDKSKKGFLIKPLSSSTALKEFFLKNPFIHVDQGKLYGAIFIDNEEVCLNGNLEKLVKHYSIQGISGLTIYRFGGDQKEKEIEIPPALVGKITIRSADRLRGF